MPEDVLLPGDEARYLAAKEMVLGMQRIAVATLQRRMRIGYNLAQKLMNRLVEEGVVEKFHTGLGGDGYRLPLKG